MVIFSPRMMERGSRVVRKRRQAADIRPLAPAEAAVLAQVVHLGKLVCFFRHACEGTSRCSTLPVRRTRERERVSYGEPDAECVADSNCAAQSSARHRSGCGLTLAFCNGRGNLRVCVDLKRRVRFRKMVGSDDKSHDTAAADSQSKRQRLTPGRSRDARGWRAKIGCIALSTNTIVQPDFDDFAHCLPGVTNHMGRITIPNMDMSSDEGCVYIMHHD